MIQTKPGDCRNLKEMDSESLSARDKILRTALILFNKNGVHRTGIDKIIAEAGVAKMTFYNHFASKDALVGAYLSESEEIRFDHLRRHTVDRSDDPKKQLLGAFDYLEEWFKDSDFCGCPFTRGLSDYADKRDSENFKFIQSHFSKWTIFVEERVSKIVKPSKVKTVIPQMLTLIVGSVTLALAGADPRVAQINKKLADQILADNV